MKSKSPVSLHIIYTNGGLDFFASSHRELVLESILRDAPIGTCRAPTQRKTQL